MIRRARGSFLRARFVYYKIATVFLDISRRQILAEIWHEL